MKSRINSMSMVPYYFSDDSFIHQLRVYMSRVVGINYLGWVTFSFIISCVSRF